MYHYVLIWPILEGRAEIRQKKVHFLEDLKTPKFHSEINWPLDTYDHIDDRGQIKPRRISHNWTAPVYTAKEGHNWWWSIQNETAFEILMSENLPRRLHFFCLETCHVVYGLTPSVYLLASVQLWNFFVIHSKICGPTYSKVCIKRPVLLNDLVWHFLKSFY